VQESWPDAQSEIAVQPAHTLSALGEQAVAMYCPLGQVEQATQAVPFEYVPAAQGSQTESVASVQVTRPLTQPAIGVQLAQLSVTPSTR
jgi:hypothetical protein